MRAKEGRGGESEKRKKRDPELQPQSKGRICEQSHRRAPLPGVSRKINGDAFLIVMMETKEEGIRGGSQPAKEYREDEGGNICRGAENQKLT